MSEILTLAVVLTLPLTLIISSLCLSSSLFFDSPFVKYHAFAENDFFWGTNFTEWSNLQLAFYNPWNFQAIKHPIATHGAYYNFLDRDQRERVGRLARHYGIEGLAYHHYWYNCDTRFMEGPLQRLLRDGEPNLPFAFIWANHKWTRHWDGHNGEVIQDQTYGDETCWRLHFQWLLPFFQHPNYIKVNGKPMFLFYVLFEIPEPTFRGMVKLWRQLAVEAGLPGLHLVECLNRDDTEASPLVDAVMEYQPNMRRAYIRNNEAMVPTIRLHEAHYRGEYIGWDNFPRHNSNPSYENGGFDDDPVHVEARLRDRMAIARNDPNKDAPNFFFLTAWNEWGEGNNLEPDNLYGYGSLNAMASAYVGSRQNNRQPATEAHLLTRLMGFMTNCELEFDLFFYSQMYDIDLRQFQGWSDWRGPDENDSLEKVKGENRGEKLLNHWREIGFFRGREFRLKPNKEVNEGWTMPSIRECKYLTNSALDKVVVRFYLERLNDFDHFFV